MSTDGVTVLDVYREPFGVRTVGFTNTKLLINNKSFYCLGLGRHEDSDVSFVSYSKCSVIVAYSRRSNMSPFCFASLYELFSVGAYRSCIIILRFWVAKLNPLIYFFLIIDQANVCFVKSWETRTTIYLVWTKIGVIGNNHLHE